MLRKIRKILKNVEARVKVLSVFMMLILVSLTAVFIINPIIDINVKADTAEDFSYAKKITLDHDQVPGDLTNFPVAMNITDDSDLFAHCVNDSGYDIAFFDSTNTTQFAHEIEYWNWDTGNSEVDAFIWVNVTSLSSSVDTVLYMYYGNDDTDQQNYQGVWDTNVFEAVYHFHDSDLSSQKDSTANNHNITSKGGSPVRVIDDFGYAMDLGDAADYVVCPNMGTLFGSPFSVGVWLKPDDGKPETTRYIYGARDDDGTDESRLQCTISLTAISVRYETTNGYDDVSADAFLDQAYSYYVCMHYVNNGTHQYEYRNGSLNTTGGELTNSAPISNYCDDVDARTPAIGSLLKNGAPETNGYLGSIDEFRFYCINISSNWMITEYNSISNSTDGGFFTLGEEQAGLSGASVYTIKGLPSDIVTWSGTAGNTVWCNDSGDYNEYLEINMTINASDNITEIRVWVGDLNDTTAWINASNITLYVSSDNSSYGVPTHDLGNGNGVFTDGGANISINSSTWPAGGGDNPFDGAGLTDKNTSIFCVFKLAIPADSPTDIFYSLTATTWKIYLGYYE